MAATGTKKKDQAEAYKPYTYTDYRTQVYPNYSPIDKTGNDYAALSGFSQEDYNALSDAWAQWNAADKAGDQVGKDAAHSAAEAIRSKYGYSGGEDGSQFIPSTTTAAQQNSGWSYGEAPTYTEKYQEKIDALMDQLLNREDFSYNYLEDPLYQQYRDAYTREGTRAMLDTMGQAAARTGGYLSTAGQVAAQQANNYYMAQLGDKIPELQQLAYDMWMDEYETDVNNLGLMQGLEEFNYDKFSDVLRQWNTDREFNYGVYRDSVGDQRYMDELLYDRNLSRAELLAALGDFSGYEALGYSASDIARLNGAYAAANTLSGSTGSGSGGPGRDEEAGSIYQQMYNNGLRTEGDAYAYLLANGHSSTEANKLAGYFAEQVESGKFDTEDEETDTGTVSSGLDLNAANFDDALRRARNIRNTSGASNALAFIEYQLDTRVISEKQMEIIMDELGL